MLHHMCKQILHDNRDARNATGIALLNRPLHAVRLKDAESDAPLQGVCSIPNYLKFTLGPMRNSTEILKLLQHLQYQKLTAMPGQMRQRLGCCLEALA